MTLRAKFVLVLVLLAGTLFVNVSATVWGLRFLRRELSDPLESIQTVMSALHQVKRAGEDQAAMIGAGRIPSPADIRVESASMTRDFDDRSKLVRDQINRMEELPTARVRSGITATRNLLERTSEIDTLANEWFASESGSPPEALVLALGARHELIERIEGRIIEDAALAVNHGEKLRGLVLLIIGVSVIGAVSMALLMALLVRRWLLVPIKSLREAAERFGAGDLSYRVQLSPSDELGRLGAEFNTMALTIKQMQDERIERERLAAVGEMARRIVHNLRTPLSGIRSLAETTRSELDDHELTGFQDRIITTVDRFEGWLQEVLRASNPIDLHVRVISPASLIENVTSTHDPAARARGVQLVVSSDGLPVEVSADPIHLEHALTALVSNAIEFAPRNSVVSIGGDSVGRNWVISVEDGGPGVPEDARAAIFRPYVTTRQGGTGIGLALVKRVAEQHGGTVTVTTPENGLGSRFELAIPIGLPDNAKTRMANPGHNG